MNSLDRLKDSFIAGVILLTPVVVTVFIVQILYNWTIKLLEPVVNYFGLIQLTGFDFTAQILAGTLVLTIVVVLGAMSKSSSGRRAFGDLGKVVSFVPFVRVVYKSIRDVIHSVVSKESDYDQPVMIEYPREGLYSLGFLTGKAQKGIAIEDDLVTVFLPNSPNPTGGKMVAIHRDDVTEVDIPVRRALRIIMTTGLSGDIEEE